MYVLTLIQVKTKGGNNFIPSSCYAKHIPNIKKNSKPSTMVCAIKQAVNDLRIGGVTDHYPVKPGDDFDYQYGWISTHHNEPPKDFHFYYFIKRV